MVTILGVLLVLFLLFGVPFVFVVSYVAARARKEMAEAEATKAEEDAAAGATEDDAVEDPPPG